MRGVVLVSLLAAVASAQAPTAVSLSLEPATPVKGRDTTATLEIQIAGVDRPAPPVLRANVGRLEGVERTGPGRFRARYVLPTTRFPEVAIIVAFAPWPHPQAVEGAFGVLRVPLSSAVEVPGRAERGAEVRIAIANREFGPVTAQPDGTFRLPVEVPPGFGLAKTITVDRVGNKRSSPLDLLLPPTDQLACVVTPTRLPADGTSRARVLCASSDRFGAPTKGARVQWKGGRGTWSAPRELGDGVQEWSWTSPRDVGSGVEHLSATWKQGKVDSNEEISVELAQGAVQTLELAAGDPVAHAGSLWKVVARAKDRQGRPLAGVFVEGPSGERVVTDERGEALVRWPIPEQEPLGARSLSISAWGPMGKEPANLLAWRSEGGVRAAVTDLAGLPVPGQRLLVGTSELVTGPDGAVSAPERGELVHAEWPGLRTKLEDAGQVRARISSALTVRIAPPLPVNVRTSVDGDGLEWWVENPLGEVLDGRSIDVRTGEGVRRATSQGKTRERVTRGVVTITDVTSRVSAVVEVSR
jgi:hypothetical protein